MKKYLLFIIAILFILTSLTSYSSIQQKSSSTEKSNNNLNMSNTSTIASNYVFSSSVVQENTEPTEESNNTLNLDDNTNDISNKNDNIMLQYDKLIKKDCKPSELIDFINKNINKVRKEKADKIISILIEVLQKKSDIYFKDVNRKVYEGELFSAYDTYDHMLIYDNITDEKLKSLVKEIQDCGYKLILCGGIPSFTPIIDFESLKKYNRYLPKKTNEFIEIMAVESNIQAEFNPENPMPLTELIKRTLDHEKYIAKYHSRYKHDTITENYLKYTKALLFGTSPNTPVKNWDTGKINNDVLDTYKKVIKKNKETILGKTLMEYVKLIENNDFVIDDNIKNQILNIFKNYLKELENSRM